MKKIGSMSEAEFAMLVSRTVQKVINSQGEQYVTGKRLSEMFQMFNRTWIKKYGHLLPRIEASVLFEEDGRKVKTGFAYPVNQIRQMIDNNQLDFVYKQKCEYRESKH